MSKTQEDPGTGGSYAGLKLLTLIMGASFAVSFTHVHELFAWGGQDDWTAWVLAVAVELLFTGSSLEIMRRHKSGEPVWPAVLLLMIGIGMTLWGNLATARPAVGAILTATFAPTVTALVVLVIKLAWSAKSDRQAAAEQARREAEEAAARREAVRSARAARQDTVSGPTSSSTPARPDTGQDSRPDTDTGQAVPAQDPQTVPGIAGGAVDNVDQTAGKPRLELVGGSRKTRLPDDVLDDLLSDTPQRKQKDVAEQYSTTERTIRRIVAEAREARDRRTSELPATGEASG